jgi:hypothetical protein
MLDMRGFKGFCLAKGDCSHEANQVVMYTLKNDIPLIRVPSNSPCPEGYVPSGSVEWCSLALHYIEPDYYPAYLKEHLHRKVWRGDTWQEEVFVKPADAFKRFTGYVVRKNCTPEKPPFWYSECVSFTNEWRYYVSRGKVLCAGWYAGDEQRMPPAPPLNIKLPEDICAALDFGTLEDGTLALVESQPPFACGWYGKEHPLYLQWLVDGWKYLKVGN